MDFKLQEITLPNFLWYVLPGLVFVLVVVAIPILLLAPELLRDFDSLGGLAAVVLLALVAGFVMDSLKLYAVWSNHEKLKKEFFESLSRELNFRVEQTKVLMDALRLGLHERGSLGRAVAFNHSRWVMMAHSAKCFYVFAGVWAIVSVVLHLGWQRGWYREQLGLQQAWATILVDALLIALMVAIGKRIDRHATKQRHASDKLYYQYARRYSAELRRELLGEGT